MEVHGSCQKISGLTAGGDDLERQQALICEAHRCDQSRLGALAGNADVHVALAQVQLLGFRAGVTVGTWRKLYLGPQLLPQPIAQA